MAGYKSILLEKQDHIATLTLNRPEVMNSLTLEMFDEINHALKNINEDNDIRVMILTGAGKAFCSSLDIKEAGAAVGKRLLPDKGIEDVRQIARHGPQKVTLGIHQMDKPTSAMVNGLAMADGFDWVLACDIRIGSENAKFMNGFGQMGLVPNTGACWLYPRVMGLSKALELMYTSDWLEAEEAHRIGVLSRLVKAEDLLDETLKLARKIAAQAPIPLRIMKMQTYKGLSNNLETMLELAADGEVMCLFTEDHVEAISAFLEKRPPKFRGK